ncbi:MAG: hypothetical protein JWO35_666 [Candidatus Saccharibacteria bacterium]|nr:hypothetical protein [Candidatus Saccharibacteria bacterium]
MSVSEAAPYIKDYASALLSLTATVIAILAYKRARETILQPIRSEVIKKQTELLINLLELVGDEIDISHKVDYEGVIAANIYRSMLDCGAIFTKQEELEEKLKNEIRGGLLSKRSEDLIELVPIFAKKPVSKKDKTDSKKKYYEAAKKGKYKLPIINLTKSYCEFQSEIERYINSPFLPSKFKELLEKLLEDLHYNISELLPHEVEKAINISFKNGGKDIPSPTGVYNLFHRKIRSHNETIVELRNTVRAYLKIDSMP